MSRYIYEGDIYGTTQAEDIKLTKKQTINDVEVDNVDDAIKNINKVIQKSGVVNEVSYDQSSDTFNFGTPESTSAE